MEKVLIVFDSKTIRQILGDMMNSLGYENKAATDGLQALTMLKEEVFSVVISDIEMPGIDGLTLIKKIKENSPEIDVISITGFGTKYSYSEVIKTGASDFFTISWKKKLFAPGARIACFFLSCLILMNLKNLVIPTVI